MESDPGDIDDRIEDALRDVAEDRALQNDLQDKLDSALGDRDDDRRPLFSRRLPSRNTDPAPVATPSNPTNTVVMPVISPVESQPRPNLHPFNQIFVVLEELKIKGLLNDPIALHRLDIALEGLARYYRQYPDMSPLAGMTAPTADQLRDLSFGIITPRTPDTNAPISLEQNQANVDSINQRIKTLNSSPETEEEAESLQLYLNGMDKSPENIARLTKFLADVDGIRGIIQNLNFVDQRFDKDRLSEALNNCFKSAIDGKGALEIDANTLNVLSDMLSTTPHTGSELENSMDPRVAWVKLMRTMIQEYQNNPELQKQITQEDLLTKLKEQLQNLGPQIAGQVAAAGGQIVQTAEKAAVAVVGTFWELLRIFILQMAAGIVINTVQQGFSTK